MHIRKQVPIGGRRGTPNSGTRDAVAEGVNWDDTPVGGGGRSYTEHLDDVPVGGARGGGGKQQRWEDIPLPGNKVML